MTAPTDAGAFEIVVAADQSGGIGLRGDLPWRLRGDMRHFKRLTSGTTGSGARNAVVMGRKTWDSIPDRFRPLSRRLNVVVTRTPDLALPDGVLRAGSLDEALELARKAGAERTFVIGGASLYNEALGRVECRRVHLTRVQGTFECDCHLAPIPSGFVVHSESPLHQEEGGSYTFVTLERPPE